MIHRMETVWWLITITMTAMMATTTIIIPAPFVIAGIFPHFTGIRTLL